MYLDFLPKLKRQYTIFSAAALARSEKICFVNVSGRNVTALTFCYCTQRLPISVECLMRILDVNVSLI